ncbi:MULTISPECIES: choice-of-anchor X domain-containing protein [unclassified Pseudoalteromonas]|uniref:choice-of-anchor X domain-containing protein n=1 Tax=unclassified Pseudoalteromonas TaxID=194690 RepID=UPI0030154EBF
MMKPLVIVLIWGWLMSSPALAKQVFGPMPIGMANSKTYSLAIESGMTQITIPFDVDQTDSVQIELIIPVDEATFQVLDPNGIEIIAFNDPRIKFEPGEQQTPPVPGTYALLPELQEPMPGQWQINVEFPEVDYKTLAIAQLHKKSPIGLGMAIPRTHYVFGDPMIAASLLVNNGEPITDAEVDFVITAPNGTRQFLTARDDGIDGDPKANDGIYSVLYEFPLTGEYLIESSARLQHNGALVKRTVSKRVKVLPARVNLTAQKLTAVETENGCVSHVEQEIELYINVAGGYAINTRLTDGSNTLNKSTRFSLPQGEWETVIKYTKEELKESFGDEPTLETLPSSFVSTTEMGVGPAAPMLAFDNSLDLSQLQFCRDPIEVGEKLISRANYSSDGSYIESLSFAFSVYADNPGNYSGSFNISAADRTRLELISFDKAMNKGENLLEFTVPGTVFQQADGPYELNSLLIYTRGHSKRKLQLGTTESYQKENFIPKMKQTLAAKSYGLERVNWQSVPAISDGVKRIGGYLRAGASIPYDYEVLGDFNLSEISGHIIKAKLTVTLGNSSLVQPFTQVDVYQVVSNPWELETLEYDYFCQSFTLCPPWQHKIVSLDVESAENGQIVVEHNKLTQLLNQWRAHPKTNQGIIFTLTSHERGQFIELEGIEVELEHLITE